MDRTEGMMLSIWLILSRKAVHTLTTHAQYNDSIDQLLLTEHVFNEQLR